MFLLFSSFQILAQDKKPRKIHIIRSDSYEFDEKIDPDLRMLIGNVILRHDSVYMHCDSAYFFTEENSFIAYSRVKVVQGDSIYLYGDTLFYQGNFSEGKVRGNVKLIDKKMELTTQFLDFNMETNISHYFNGGTIVDSANVLTSETGYYYSEVEEYYFEEQVYIETPDYTMLSDTLTYTTESGETRFRGPTLIEGDSSMVYSEHGYYNTNMEFMKLGWNSYIVRNENTIEADSIFFNQITDRGNAWRNVVMTDTLQQIILKGEYAYLNKRDEFSFVTDSAIFMQYEGKDTLFLHADTLFSLRDSTGEFRVLKAYYKAKFFREEMQGMCDSLIYTTADSLIKLYNDPILWSDENQLTADFIKIHFNGNEADKIYMENTAFIISKETNIYFNQIFGKHMEGFINRNRLYKIYVKGNAQTIYYPIDGTEYIGENKAESSNMTIYLEDGKVKRINFLNAPEGVLNPMDRIEKDKSYLKGFGWHDEDRPLGKLDIYKRHKAKSEETEEL
jgi:lipopolysaccharide export system protein LptA